MKPEAMNESLPEIDRGTPVSIRSILAALFRRKLLFLSLFTSIVAIATLLTMLMPKKYESRMKVLVKNERADMVVSPDPRNGAQPRTDVSEAQVNSEIELLKSNDLLAKVVQVCRLYERSEAVHASGDARPEGFERAVRKLQRDLKIIPVRKANIIQITYSAENPLLAASVLKELAAAYLDAHLTIHRTAGTTDFFQNQASRYENELRELESNLSNFRRQHSITSMGEQKDLVLRKTMDAEASLHDTDTALAETTTRVAELRRQVAAHDRRIVTQSRVMPNQYSVERLNTMLAELQNRRTQALMKFHADDRVVVEIEQEIADTRAAMERASKLNSVEQVTDVNPVRQNLEAELARAELQQAGLQSRRTTLATVAGGYRARLAQLENATIDHETLQRSVKEAEENYLLYTRKQEEGRIADSLDQQKIGNVAIAEAPVPSHLPAKPNVLLNLALGVLFAAFVSFGAVFAAEYSQSAFHTPADLESATGLPVLATVPYQSSSPSSLDQS
jgi:uncharacterized protein involved in exopolysaccharide biosynthesis